MFDNIYFRYVLHYSLLYNKDRITEPTTRIHSKFLFLPRGLLQRWDVFYTFGALWEVWYAVNIFRQFDTLVKTFCSLLIGFVIVIVHIFFWLFIKKTIFCSLMVGLVNVVVCIICYFTAFCLKFLFTTGWFGLICLCAYFYFERKMGGFWWRKGFVKHQY